ncbi:MAG TPA: cupin domain-containing protein [Thermoplasmata archaeon]|nr:cupin domain-containing protein [Thermoplasmata archaeon]
MGAPTVPTSGFQEEPPPRWVSIAPGMQMRPLVEGSGTLMFLYRIEAGTQITEHRHSYPALGVVLSGEGFLVLDGEQRGIRAGDSYYMPPNVSHGFAMPPRGEPVVLVDVSSGLDQLEERLTVESILELARSVARRDAPLV